MADLKEDKHDETPLDPAIEGVRRKLARLMAVSIGIMLVGLMAVLGTVVYKAAGSGAPATSQATITLPAGFSVEDTAVSDNRILFYGLDGDGTRHVLVYDAGTGLQIGDHHIVQP